MSEISNLKDVLKSSPRSQTYANAMTSLGPLYKGGSNASSYVPLADKLKDSPQQNFCIACAIAGMPCSQHLKGNDAPVMSVDDLLGSASQYAGFVPQNAGQQPMKENAGVYLIVDLSKPESYAVAGAMLKAAAQYYAKQSGKDTKYIGSEGYLEERSVERQCVRSPVDEDLSVRVLPSTFESCPSETSSGNFQIYKGSSSYSGGTKASDGGSKK